MEHGKRLLLRGAGGLALLLTCGRRAGAHGSTRRLVAFGDSNVDNGNLFRLSQGMSPAPPAWQGRASNGPVVVEYLAARASCLLESYAVGGATTGLPNIQAQDDFAPTYPTGTGLHGQIDAFELGGNRFGPKDVAVVWAGSNDIRGARREDRPTLKRLIARAASNIDSALTRLDQLGARHIVVANRTPRTVLGSDDDLNGVDLNVAIRATAEQAARRLATDIRLYDAYTAIATMIREPKRWGFSEVLGVCITVPACAWDAYGGPQPVGEQYVHWDIAHKTTHVHRLMGEQMAAMLAH
ncbi:SGNH/GDSL hydrolase family protein [Aquabacterium sp. A7-Y]|uniref:SGNH/GDSL hydrolase family protein n=1 Tax=Aquabacterium sp. A7-Y TaxID=1349605 RepID=UPI00223E3C78|nr:SGNH/GDSL hydrolase family protein [Aquabacterium sp. A7-Y]MCW7540632.1 SGNH/GDSL hydrolase family protein [Aquabacterium sp. A7-Y]